MLGRSMLPKYFSVDLNRKDSTTKRGIRSLEHNLLIWSLFWNTSITACFNF